MVDINRVQRLMDQQQIEVAPLARGARHNGIERGFLRQDLHTREASLAINAMLFEAARRLPLAETVNEDSRRVWSETIIGLVLVGVTAKTHYHDASVHWAPEELGKGKR